MDKNVSSNATHGIHSKLDAKIFDKGWNNMKTRLVFKVNIARKSVRMGYRIVNLKPAKTKDGKTDFNKSIFVFADENNIAEEIEKLTKVK